ncbi:hypothetical protein LCGC14_0563910 [marine sediment metagenome]|uniref:Uncharacterized protein n=1 Tax=marine sediment metagenome TaxID=412755 RepID=A0A0F9UUG9_9ZZZZ
MIKKIEKIKKVNSLLVNKIDNELQLDQKRR